MVDLLLSGALFEDRLPALQHMARFAVFQGGQNSTPQSSSDLVEYPQRTNYPKKDEHHPG